MDDEDLDSGASDVENGNEIEDQNEKNDNLEEGINEDPKLENDDPNLQSNDINETNDNEKPNADTELQTSVRYPDPLPRASLLRIAKAAIPEGFNIASQAGLAISKSTTTFILCLTCHAQENARRFNRATLSKDDILVGLQAMGFSHFRGQLIDMELPATKRPRLDNSQVDTENLTPLEITQTEELSKSQLESIKETEPTELNQENYDQIYPDQGHSGDDE
eukprot:NODE_7005_length_820_cov_33.820660_g6404_i0.p1 GENE.NODE_7005_length_820_cov_33.820660_g6404_i0~~NODE_7005_length_820_cov_33.820660_g6404_i0.p1  ORF type:complete len:221 (-),score=48.33 NODE_7005_length_820_cov_33.820660_g6404_i0:90-752(-)